MQITKHFHMDEFNRHKFPIPRHIFHQLCSLAEMLEEVRTACGDVPITVTSAYRTVAYNTQIGGVPGSHHTKGAAADITVSGVQPETVAELIRRTGIKHGELIVYGRHLHLSLPGFR